MKEDGINERFFHSYFFNISFWCFTTTKNNRKYFHKRKSLFSLMLSCDFPYTSFILSFFLESIHLCVDFYLYLTSLMWTIFIRLSHVELFSLLFDVHCCKGYCLLRICVELNITKYKNLNFKWKCISLLYLNTIAPMKPIEHT